MTETTLFTISAREEVAGELLCKLLLIFRVRELLEEEKNLPLGFVRSSCRRNDLGLKRAAFNKIVRIDLKFHPYVLAKVCKLSERAKALRITMCSFLIRQPRLYFLSTMTTLAMLFTTPKSEL